MTDAEIVKMLAERFDGPASQAARYTRRKEASDETC